jgi:hypothetical protein
MAGELSLGPRTMRGCSCSADGPAPGSGVKSLAFLPPAIGARTMDIGSPQLSQFISRREQSSIAILPPPAS